MIRKIIIVVLVAAAVGTGGLWLLSYVSCSDNWGVGKRGDSFVAFHLSERSSSNSAASGGRSHYEWERPVWVLVLSRNQSHYLLDVARGWFCIRVESASARDWRWDYHLGGIRIWRQFDRATSLGLLELWTPLWIPFVVFAAYPFVVFIRLSIGRVQRAVRRQRGLCVNCRYDLIGNVSGVCPECGTKIEERRSKSEDLRG